MPTVGLLTLVGDMVPGIKLMPTISEVFTGSEVRGEVTVPREEVEL